MSFKNVHPKIIRGIGNSQIEAFTGKVNIWVNNIKYETEADFSEDQKAPLLGRQGFFNLFKSVTFQEKEKFTILKTF